MGMRGGGVRWLLSRPQADSLTRTATISAGNICGILGKPCAAPPHPFWHNAAMKPFEPTSPASRREFVRDALRYSVLAGMGALVATAVVRRAPWGGAVCPGAGACSGCPQVAGCTRPQKILPGPPSAATKGSP
jgi:hypothetical protein